MRAGCKTVWSLRGFLPGGGSTDFMLPEHLDITLDYDEIAKVGSRLATGTMIILDDKTCPVGMVGNLMKFFRARILRILHAVSRWSALGGSDFSRFREWSGQ